MKLSTLARIGENVLRKKWRQSFLGPRTRFVEELSTAGLDFEDWLDRRRESLRQYPELGAPAAQTMKDCQPDRVAAHKAAADRVIRHEFDLLGSGPYSPADPQRPLREDGYRPIDWFHDPVRVASFPRNIPYKEWNLFEMRPANADIKYPWELARCQHFPLLGQVWLLTGEARYAEEIVSQIGDFAEANPIGIGVNWTCTMDVALRAANWAIGLALIKECDAIAPQRLFAAYEALFAHGRFIFANFENTYEVTSNHYLSNVVGLHFVASEFSDLASGRAWDAYCREALEEEIEVQILPDGADFESSLPYHRLVTELFLGSFRLTQIQNHPLSRRYQARLADMVDYLAKALRPDGLMPQIGDADDGRLHILSDYGRWRPQDGRHVLEPASFVLERDDWLGLGGEAGQWEAAWWGFGGAIGKRAAARAPRDHVTLFPDAGAFVARRGGHYLLVTNARVGTKGFGNHKHNDQLSFEYHVGGAALIADPGSYVYTSDFEARNRFRSTAYHSTLCIDGEEQNDINPEWLFRMFEKAEAEHLDHGSDGTRVWYSGKHNGYKRLDESIIHERRFDFDLSSGALSIADRLTGSGRHHLRWHFHGAPGVVITLIDGHTVRLETGNRGALLRFPDGLSPDISETWYSPSYGVKEPAMALDLTCTKEFSAPFEVAFSFGPLPRQTNGGA